MRLILLLVTMLSFQASSYELYLVRHFEKRSDESNPRLTEHGEARAQALIALLADKQIQHIYSSDYRRTQQTARPISEALGLPILSYPVRDLAGFAKGLLADQKNSLIVGHSNTTPQLVSLLGGEATPIAENEFGELFVLIMLPSGVNTQSVHVGRHVKQM